MFSPLNIIKLLAFLVLTNLVLYGLNFRNAAKSLPAYDLKTILNFEVQEDDFDDFCEKVADKIANNPILLLGEQQHSDGATFLIKSKLIEILNKKYDYDLVLIETPFFYNHLLREKILNQDSVSSYDWYQAMYNFWGGSNETGLLRKTITDKKIDFRGFDYSYQNTTNLSDLSTYIQDYFGKDSLATSSLLFEILEKDYGQQHLFNNRLYKDSTSEYYHGNGDDFLNQIRALVKKVEEKETLEASDRVMLLTLENLYDYFSLNLNQSLFTDNARNEYRDSVMFKNIDYIINHITDKKVIVWAANAHLMYEPWEDDYLPIGYRLKKEYKDEVYSVLFTSGVGENRPAELVRRINSSSLKSVEYLLHKENKNYIYGTIKDDRSFIMKFLGHENISFPWKKAMDSYIYIDKMTPTTYKND